MTKISITIEGSPEEVREALKKLFDSVPVANQLLESGSDDSTNSNSSTWAAEEVAQVWFAIKEGAHDVLAGIARHEGECDNQTLQRELGAKNGFQIAGRMSSYGFALKRLGLTHKEPLYRYDYAKQVYLIKPEIADFIIGLAKGKTSATSHTKAE